MIVAVLAADRTAAAQPCSEETKKVYERAKAHYDTGEFDEAAALFKRAFDLCPRSYGILQNAGQASRFAGKYDKAIIYFESWLRTARTDPKVSKIDIEETERLVQELARQLAAQKRTDEKPPKDLKRPDPPLEDGPRPWYSDRWGWILAGAGTVILATGAGFLAWSYATADDARNTRDHAVADRLFDDAESRGTIGAVSTIVGGVLLVGGVVHFAIYARDQREHRDLRDREHRRTTVSVGPGSISLSWSF
jgi:tetratricopeptide (TPR) repeat protein